MNFWRFLRPSMIGFASKNVLHGLIDKLSGAPTRPLQAAQYLAEHARAGDPADVLRTMDRFAAEERWMMNVGPEKGPLIQELAERLPANARILELGAYSGYSAIMIAHRFGPQARVTSIEIDEDAVRASRANVELAGLRDRITILHGPSGEIIPTLEGRFDLVFLDHWKDLYKADLERIEAQGLIGAGSLIVADNVGDVFDPGDYLDYVRNCGRYASENRAATIEYTTLPDAVEISVFL